MCRISRALPAMLLLEAIQATINRQPHAPAFIHEGQVISYQGMQAIVHALCRQLYERGIQAGDVIGVSMAQTPLHCCAVIALAKLGAISIPITPDLAPGVTEALFRRHHIKCLLTDLNTVASSNVPIFKLNQLSPDGHSPHLDFLSFIPQPESPFRIALTSGTSGPPKGVRHTHASFMQRIEQTIYDCNGETRLLAPDMHITLSMVFALGVLTRGGVVVFPNDYRIGTMSIAIQTFGVTHLIQTPAHASAFAQALPDSGPSFPSLKHLRIVGATPSAALVDMLARRGTAHLYSPYALTEVGVVTMATADQLRGEPHGAGKVQPWAKVEILTETGNPCPIGQSGTIRLSVVGMPSHYEGDAEHYSSRFEDGWFYPGDIGYFLPDGQLLVTGRADDILNVGGNKIDPSVVENVLNQHGGVVESAVFLSPCQGEESVLTAAIVPQGNSLPAGLSEWAEKHLGLLAPKRYIKAQPLPKSITGKLKRKEIALAYMSNCATHL